MASGAFPVGLASRQLGVEWNHYLTRRYPIPVPPDVLIQPDFPPEARQADSFVFESVDGGLANNDPFDYAQYALMGGPPTPASGETVEQVIIMVAPFPDRPKFPPEGTPSPAVTAIVRALFPALVNQSRFRSSELAPAIDERDFSRFLIAPLRRIPRTEESDNVPPPERFSIACGLLGGFGGFLDEKFRAHDFQLGRRNCQNFLRTSFLVPGNNRIVGNPGSEGGSLPVIPLLGSAAQPVPLPIWPQMSEHDFAVFCDRMVARIDAVVPRLINSQTRSVKLRAALRMGWHLFLRSRTINFMRLAILSDLIRRDQIKSWEAPGQIKPQLKQYERPPEDAQAIIAELVNPAFDFRTPHGISKKTRLLPEFVEAVLLSLTGPEVPTNFRVWQSADGYVLFARRPSFLRRLKIVRWFNSWWNAPTID
jgi:hypothetical protein